MIKLQDLASPYCKNTNTSHNIYGQTQKARFLTFNDSSDVLELAAGVRAGLGLVAGLGDHQDGPSDDPLQDVQDGEAFF